MPQNATYAYIGAFVDELARTGLRQVCICPGSRSTPLAIVFAQHPGLRVWMHLDERSAAFFALGLAKAGREPVALLCTSGTAAANFLPAIVEARLAQVPLVVLTADRPPELREVGAPQTIDQIRLYGSHVKWSVEMATPDATDELLRYARTTACRAVATSLATPRGPVHLNFPLREPLVPDSEPDTAVPEGVSELALYGRRDGRPWVVVVPGLRLRPDGRDETAAAGWDHTRAGTTQRVPPALPGSLASGAPGTVVAGPTRAGETPAPPGYVAEIARAVGNTPEGLIVCGPLDDPDLAGPVVALAALAGYPILADPLSGLRAGPHNRDLVVDGYDAILRVEEAAASVVPRLVLRFGAMPTSKPLLQYLQRHPMCRQIVVASGSWQDPTQLADQMIDAVPSAFCAGLAGVLCQDEGDSGGAGILPALRSGTGPRGAAHEGTPGHPPEGRIACAPGGSWLGWWLEVNRRARAALAAELAAVDELFEGRVFAELSQLLPDGATLWAGSSMPVRDLDTFFPTVPQKVRMLANRGANGIDGVVSSALGAAAAGPGPTVLVLGDISFYHDMNGLLAATRHGLSLTIVLLNNDGGGIFSFLPQASAPALMATTNSGESLFELLFGTPHGLDFSHAAALYGATYRRVGDWPGFRAAVQAGIAQGGLHIVEVPTDRRRNVVLHRRCWPAVAEALR